MRGPPEEALVNQTIVRGQSQAEYSPDNIGHFGLALPRYAHFTSPIRRYADLLVHRALVGGLGLDAHAADGGTGQGASAADESGAGGPAVGALSVEALDVGRLEVRLLETRVSDVGAPNAAMRSCMESTTVARPGTPRTGCNGYPFSRMKRAP